ncbi:MAG: hypothetical protein KF859_11045 [Phycisphaeraceae bacterium]|nr:hypothetical protein [Phycisphaeraceae bacterium]
MTPTPATHHPASQHPEKLVGKRALPLHIASACAALLCGAWAFWPLGSPRVDAPVFAELATAPAEPAHVALDLAAFNTPLWVAPPPPPVKVAESPPPPPPPPPAPPLKWQLLAIVREGEIYKALVYDPDSDKVLTLAEGDHSGPRRIARVTPTTIDVRDGAGTRTLALREPGARP